MLWNSEKCQAWEAVVPFIFRYLPMGTGCGWQQHWDPLALGDVPWGNGSLCGASTSAKPLALAELELCSISSIPQGVTMWLFSKRLSVRKSFEPSFTQYLKGHFFFVFSQGIVTVGLTVYQPHDWKYANISEMMQIFILFGIIASPVLLMIVSFFEWTLLPFARYSRREGHLVQTSSSLGFVLDPDSLPSAVWWQCVGAGRELGASVLQGIWTVS